MVSGNDQPVVVVGAGLSGLATALGLALRGRPSVVLEAADLVGGAAAYSGGQVWSGVNHVAQAMGIEDSHELTARYIRDVASHDAPEVLDEEALERWIEESPKALKYWEEVGAIKWTVIPGLADYHNEADGALPEGRYLTNEVIDGSVLGEWREKLRYSPYFPVGQTYREMLGKGRRASYVEEDAPEKHGHAGLPAFGLADGSHLEEQGGESDPLTFGTGVVASFLARVIQEPSIDIRLEHRATKLLTNDSGEVIGVRAETPNGEVEFNGPVVLATSTYDWDPELAREMLGTEPEDFGSVAPETLRGDAIHMVREIGADVAKIPATSVPILPGWKSQVGTGYGYGPEYAMPHSMIVDETGNRYCNDSYWVDIVAKTLNPKNKRLPFFLIWDDQHRQKYGLAGTPPGGEYPEGWVESADTLEELGQKLGIDGEQLAATAERFSENARKGVDPDFGRGTITYVNKFAGDPTNKPSPVLGEIAQGPFHGVRLRFVGTGIGSSGVRIDADARVLNPDGSRVKGLYAVGSAAGLTTTGSAYNSGIALGRGLTHAYLVSRELTDELQPAAAASEVTES